MKKIRMTILIPVLSLLILLVILQTNAFSLAIGEPVDGDVTIFLGRDIPVLGRLFHRNDDGMRWYPGYEGQNKIYLNNLSGNDVRLNWAKAIVSGIYNRGLDGQKGEDRQELMSSVLENYVLRISDGEMVYYEGLLKDFEDARYINSVINANTEDRELRVDLKLLETADNSLQDLIIDLNFEFDFEEIIVADNSGSGSDGSGARIPQTETILDDEIALAPGEGHWSDEAIDYLYDIDVLTVIPGAIFPDEGINRAEAGSVIVRLLGYEGDEGLENIYYMDTLPTYASDYLIEGSRLGVLEGYPDGYYRPYDPVTRAEFAAMISRAFEMEGDTKNLEYYKDYETFAESWAVEELAAMHDSGYYIGYEDQTLRPERYLTNGEAYTVLHRIALAREGE